MESSFLPLFNVRRLGRRILSRDQLTDRRNSYTASSRSRKIRDTLWPSYNDMLLCDFYTLICDFNIARSLTYYVIPASVSRRGNPLGNCPLNPPYGRDIGVFSTVFFLKLGINIGFGKASRNDTRLMKYH
jgi:hypothetical protein